MPSALLVDYGGVLTTEAWECMREFCRGVGLPPDTLIAESGPGGRLHRLVSDVESGAMTTRAFEREAAAALGLRDDRDFVRRVFGALAVEDRMIEAVRRLRRGGVRTCLVSNSWGSEMYALERLEGAFDAQVISGEVRLRKPDPKIYQEAARRLGVEPSDCVFVDDYGQNLKPARALGMHTILHRDVDATLAELQRVFAIA